MAQPLALCAAFWTALALYRGARPRRLAVGLVLGAAFAHLGWALLHPRDVWEHPAALAHPLVGFCVLFVPLGPLVAAPGPEALRALPAALAVARLGCLLAGCCLGTPTALPWALSGLHPTPLYEVAGLMALHLLVLHLPAAWSPPAVLVGFGLLRLLLEPLRAAPPLGRPAFPAAWIASAWMGLGLWLALRRAGRRAARAA